MTTDVGSFETARSPKERSTPVSKRVSPTESIRAQIDALFDGSRELVEIIEDVARLGAQLIIQTAVEAEVTAFLGRARYERAGGSEQAASGSRNGFRRQRRSRPRPGRSTCSGRSCVAPASRSSPGCSAPASRRATRLIAW